MILGQDSITPSKLRGGSFVRQVIDPEGTLPDITLIAPNKSAFDGSLSSCGAIIHPYDICLANTVVGYAFLSHCREQQRDGYHFAGVGVDPTYHWRKLGIGIATYVLAIEAAHSDGRPFITDHVLTTPAVTAWQRFVAIGVAEVITSFTDYDLGVPHDQLERFYGDVRIGLQQLPPVSGVLTTAGSQTDNS